MKRFEVVWERIRAHAGAEFRLSGGRGVSYEVVGGMLRTDRSSGPISTREVRDALWRMPVRGAGDLADLPHGAVLHAILSDPRIRRTDW